MFRKTKIVASLGPATDSEEVLAAMIKAGVNVVRINFSHGTEQDHVRRIKQVRKIASNLTQPVAILGDLQGPKVRIESFKNKSITLFENNVFTIDTNLDQNAGDDKRVGTTYKALPQDVKCGDVLLLDDGNISLLVNNVTATHIETCVLVGGQLSNNKGINKKGGGLSVNALTNKDKRDIKLAAKFKVDYLAVSFARNKEDIETARRLNKEAGGKADIVAKIERQEGLANIDEIIDASEVIMIARGDLGVEIGDADLPGVQKKLIRTSRERNRAVITATQMMQSMIQSQQPTRAEVLDVANAVMDGTDAVMLSAETAIGKYPVSVISAVDRICIGAERHAGIENLYEMSREFGNTEEAIGMATMFTASQFRVSAIVSLTESGRSAILMSRYNAKIPIYALTRNPSSSRRMAVYRGITPMLFDIMQTENTNINAKVIKFLTEKGLIVQGENIIITRGDMTGIAGGTNSLKIMTVGDVEQ